MGLDMYLYQEEKNKKNALRKEIAYWRKHPDLHSFIETYWRKEFPDEHNFNCVTYKIPKELAQEIVGLSILGVMPESPGGSFFGKSYAQQHLDTAKTFKYVLDNWEQYDFYYEGDY